LLHPLNISGALAWLPGVITAIFDESYLAGTLLLFGLLREAVHRQQATSATKPAAIAA
jgi:hypothetical protein